MISGYLSLRYVFSRGGIVSPGQQRCCGDGGVIIITHMTRKKATDLLAHIDTYTLTDEQKAIVDAARARKNIVVQAGAGTGKTTTMGFIAEVCAREGRRVYYTAFNRSIADDVRESFSPCANSTAEISTVHALCLRTMGVVSDLQPLREKFRRLHSKDADKVPRNKEIVTLMRDQAPRSFYYRSLRHRKQHGARASFSHFTPTRLVGLALDVVRNYCLSDDDEITAEHVSIPRPLEVYPSSATYKEDVDTQRSFVRLMVRMADTLWSMICDPSSDVLLSHDHYLKIVSNHDCDPFAALGLPYDTCIMFDEAQDARPAMTRIIRRVMAQPFTQYTVVVVGDSAQAIYGSFTGAVDALPVFEEVLDNCYIGTLTRTRRFGEELAVMPNEVLDALDAPIRLHASSSMSSQCVVVSHDECDTPTLFGGPDPIVLDKVRTGTTVLVRTNAQALRATAETAAQGYKVASTVDVRFIRSVVDDYFSIHAGHWKRNNPALYDIKDAQDLKELLASLDEGYVDPQYSEFVALFRMIQIYGADMVLQSVNCLVSRDEADVLITTVHKAKGQQWDDVVLYMGAGHAFPDIRPLTLSDETQYLLENDRELTDAAKEDIAQRNACGEAIFGATWQMYLDTIATGAPDTRVLKLDFILREELMVLYVALTRARGRLFVAASFCDAMDGFMRWLAMLRSGDSVI